MIKYFSLFALFIFASCNVSSQKMCVQVKARFEDGSATQAEKDFTVERLKLRLENARIKPDVTFSEDVITVNLPCEKTVSPREIFRHEQFGMYETFGQKETWRYLDDLKEKAELTVIDRETADVACIGTCEPSISMRLLDFLASAEVKEQLPADMAFYCGKPDPQTLSVPIFAIRKSAKPPINAMMIKKAGTTKFEHGGDYYDTTLELQNPYAKTFADFTQKNAGRAIAMLMGDEVIYCPVVPGRIEGGKVNISAHFSKSEAENLAKRINFGLPLKVLIFEESMIK